jgi:hypothetical protein
MRWTWTDLPPFLNTINQVIDVSRETLSAKFAAASLLEWAFGPWAKRQDYRRGTCRSMICRQSLPDL